MKEQLNKYLKRSTLLSSARILYVFVVLFLFIYYPKNLPKSTFAQYQQIFILVSFGSVLLSVGLPFVIGLLQNGPFLKQTLAIFKKAKLFYLVVGAVILGRLFISSDFSFPIILSVLLLIISGVAYNIAESLLIKLKADKAAFLINIAYALLFLVVHVYLLPVKNIEPLIIAWAVISVCKTGIAAFILFKKDSGHNGALLLRGDVYAQWRWLAANDTVEIVYNYIDKLLLPFIISNELFAVYVMGTYEIPIFTVIISVIGFQFNVQHSDDNSDQHTLRLFNSSALFLACGLFPIFFFLFLNTSGIFHFLFNDKYDLSIPLFRFTTLLIPLRIAYYTSVILVKKENKFVLCGTVLSFVLYLLFIALLYPLFGLIGIVWATLISTYLQAAYYLVVTARIVKKSVSHVFPFKYLLILLSINFAVMGGSSYFLKGAASLQSLLLALISFVICIAINYSLVYKYYNRKNVFV